MCKAFLLHILAYQIMGFNGGIDKTTVIPKRANVLEATVELIRYITRHRLYWSF
jgi:hypothetical protein